MGRPGSEHRGSCHAGSPLTSSSFSPFPPRQPPEHLFFKMSGSRTAWVSSRRSFQLPGEAKQEGSCLPGPRNRGPPAVRPQHGGTRCEQMTGPGRSPAASLPSPGHVLPLHPLSTPSSATLPCRSPKDFRERAAPRPPAEFNAERRDSRSPLPKAANLLALPPRVPPAARGPGSAPRYDPRPSRGTKETRRPAAARSRLRAPPGPSSAATCGDAAARPATTGGSPQPARGRRAGPRERAARPHSPPPAAPPRRRAAPGRALPRGPPRPRRPRRAPSGAAAARPGPRGFPHLVKLPLGGFPQRRVHGAPQGLNDGVGVHAGGGRRRGAGAGAAPRRAHMDPPPRSGRRRERKGSAKGPDRAAPAAARPPAAPFRRPRPAPRRTATREL